MHSLATFSVTLRSSWRFLRYSAHPGCRRQLFELMLPLHDLQPVCPFDPWPLTQPSHFPLCTYDQRDISSVWDHFLNASELACTFVYQAAVTCLYSERCTYELSII